MQPEHRRLILCITVLQVLGASFFVAGQAAGASPPSAPRVRPQQRDTVPCNETVLRALPNREPRRIILGSAGVSFILPDGMRLATPTEARRIGAEGSVFFNEDLSAMMIVSFARRTRIETPEDMAKDLQKAGVHVDEMRVLDQGGTQWWVFESNHRPEERNQRSWSYVTRLRGRLLMLSYLNMKNDPRWEAEFERSSASLLVHECTPPTRPRPSRR